MTQACIKEDKTTFCPGRGDMKGREKRLDDWEKKKKRAPE